MKNVVLLTTALFFSNFALGQTVNFENPNRPFPYAKHIKYYGYLADNGTIANNDVVVSFYEKWKTKYLKSDPQGRSYIKNDEKDSAKTVTTSEAIGYGMMIEALMAGHESQARQYFDQLYAYALFHHTRKMKDNPFFSQYLMTWRQNPKFEDDKSHDSAVDGDFDIAYALLLANEQWGNNGKYNYLDSAKATLAAISEQEIDAKHLKIERGNANYHNFSYGYNIIRLSDFMPSHLRAFYSYTGNKLWKDLLEANYKRYELVQSALSPIYGLFPDYIHETSVGHFSLITKEVPRDSIKDEDLGDGGGGANYRGQRYGYNSCRVPWRIAIDYMLNNDPDAKKIITKLNAGINIYTDAKPCNLTNIFPLADNDTKKRHRQKVETMAGNESADINIIAPFSVAAMVDNQQPEWRDELCRLLIDGKKCDNNDNPPERNYYENTIRLINLIVISHNYWAPEIKPL